MIRRNNRYRRGRAKWTPWDYGAAVVGGMLVLAGACAFLIYLFD